MLTNHLLFALFSGTCAALGSLFGKIAFGNHDLIDHMMVTINGMVLDMFDIDVPLYYVGYICKTMVLLLFIVSNVLMWLFFSKAMALSTSTVEATVVNMAANFIISGFIGRICFGEHASILFYVGLSFILLGLFIILSNQNKDTKFVDDEKME